MSRVQLQVTLWCFLQVVLFGVSNAQFSQNIGDSCQLASGGAGICKEFDDCDLNLLAREPAQPAICAWIGDDAIVCCPVPNQPYDTRQPPSRPQPSPGGRSKASQMCAEYKKVKAEKGVGTVLGGEDVKSVEHFPHIALLGYGTAPTWQCGGTLISDRFILTAAHCLNGNDRTDVTTAHVGFLDRRNRNAFGTLQEFRIVRTHRHPLRKVPKLYNDIALLELDRPVTFTKGVIPACLHEDFNIPVKTAQAVGWGDLTLGSKAGSDILQKVRLTLKSQGECSRQNPINRKLPDGIIEESQFCAGDHGKDTCQGDSGGPLQIHDTTGMPRIIGVTSFGQQCGIQPGVYTRVSHYVPWIESVIWP